MLAEASWAQGSLCPSGICHSPAVGTQLDSNCGGHCAQGLLALPPLLGHAPHNLDSWAALAQAVMQSGGFGCRELFEDRSEAFLHPG